MFHGIEKVTRNYYCDSVCKKSNFAVAENGIRKLVLPVIIKVLKM